MAGFSPAPLPHLSLVLDASLPGSAGDPAYLPHIGLVLAPNAVTNSAGDPWPLPHFALLARTGTFVGTSAYGTYTITGQDAALKAARKLTAAYGTYTVTGQASTLTKAAGNSTQYPAPLPSLSSLLSGVSGIYALTCNAGTYTLQGQVATLRRGVGLVAASGTYTIRGAPALSDYQLTAESGTYTLTGQAVTATATHNNLTADGGMYTLTGFAAGLDYTGTSKSVAGFVGTYTIQGFDATLTPGRALIAEYGVYRLTGQDAGYDTTGTFEQPTVSERGQALGYGLTRGKSKRKQREEYALSKAGDSIPSPALRQTAKQIAAEWQAGVYANEAQAAEALRQQALAQDQLWRESYTGLLQAYREALDEAAREVAAEMAARNNENALRALFLMAQH